jgi:hypothetical protein
MKKIAFLIGNDEYSEPNNRLFNAVNDATKLSGKLSALGFKCKTLSNVKSGGMYTAVSDLKSELNNYEVGLFFFAGHGVQVAGENFLSGIDTSFADEGSCKYTSVALDYIIDAFEKSSIITKIFILDACRDNPFETKMRSVGISTQFAPVYAPKGSFIAFATSPGQKASDSGIDGNGAFTSAILSHIETPGIRIEDMFKRVRNTLGTLTNNKQISWEHTSLMGDFYFNNRYLDGTFLTVYAEDAFSDSDFILTKGNIMHNIISALKSHDWYVQNPAIDKIRTVNYSTCNKDEIFVLGRNIYQAACGGANDAIQWIRSTEDKLNKLDEEPAFHLLNGILFEIYFDSKGKLRDKFKTEYLNEILGVASMLEYSKSCEFIKTHLQQYEQRIIYMPGTEDTICLDIIVDKNEEDQFYISEMRFEGRNILYNEDGSELYIYDTNNIYSYLYTLDKLEDMIRDAVAAPKKYIKINYNVGSELGKAIMSYEFKLLRYSI